MEYTQNYYDVIIVATVVVAAFGYFIMKGDTKW